jgi:hypothetical protein
MLESFCAEDRVDEEGKERLGLEIDLDAAEAMNDLLWEARDAVHEGKFKVVKVGAVALGTYVAPDSAAELPRTDRNIMLRE